MQNRLVSTSLPIHVLPEALPAPFLLPLLPCRYCKQDGSAIVLLTGSDSPVEYIRRRGGPLSTCPWHSLQASTAAVQGGLALELICRAAGTASPAVTARSGQAWRPTQKDLPPPLPAPQLSRRRWLAAFPLVCCDSRRRWTALKSTRTALSSPYTSRAARRHVPLAWWWVRTAASRLCADRSSAMGRPCSWVSLACLRCARAPTCKHRRSWRALLRSVRGIPGTPQLQHLHCTAR